MKKILFSLLVIGWMMPATTPPASYSLPSSSSDAEVRKRETLLQTGDLVFRNGKGFVSNMMRNTSQRSRKYSHVGVVVVENGYPMVYHMTDDVQGKSVFSGLRKEPFVVFCSKRFNKSIGVYRFPLSDRFKSCLMIEMDSLKKLNPRYDDAFDLNSDDRLYCTEMVWKHVILKAGATVPVSKTLNGSFVGIDDLHLAPSAKLVFHLNLKS